MLKIKTNMISKRGLLNLPRLIEFTKRIPVNEVTRPLIIQLVKAATSIGANYCETDCGETKKDFEHKMGI